MFVNLFKLHLQQILTSVLRVQICVMLMLSVLTQLAATAVHALWVTLGMEKAVVRVCMCVCACTHVHMCVCVCVCVCVHTEYVLVNGYAQSCMKHLTTIVIQYHSM